MKILKFLSAKIVVVLLLALAFFLGRLQYLQYLNKKAIESEKNKLASQISQLNEKNNELSQTLSYLKTENFKEHIARDQLNLKKDGEQVYSFSQNPDQVQSSAKPENIKSNPEKWLEYFFDTH